MDDYIKPVTKYVLLKLTYNSFTMAPPDEWDWNELIESGPGENIEFVNMGDENPMG